METFNELKNDVYEIAQAKLGQLTEEIKQRLDFELDAIERYGRTELICGEESHCLHNFRL